MTWAMVARAASRAIYWFTNTCRVWATMSPTPTIDPSGANATAPEQNTSRPPGGAHVT
jgi:hypothetical protein